MAITVKQALKSISSYPIADNAIEVALIEHTLDADAELTADIVRSDVFNIAKADILMSIVGAASISEGGFSVSATDVQSIKQLALAIYQQHGSDKADLLSDTKIYEYKGEPI